MRPRYQSSANRAYATWAPERRSSARKQYGPLPTISFTRWNGSVLARRSGMMTGVVAVLPANASGKYGNGRFRRKRIVRSPVASISSIAASNAWPKPSRAPKRRTLGTTSRPSTGVPSWKRRPSRSVSVQTLPSCSTLCPATICGWGVKVSSRPYSVSNTKRAWFRVGRAVVQTGSRTARSANGVNRNGRARLGSHDSWRRKAPDGRASQREQRSSFHRPSPW